MSHRTVFVVFFFFCMISCSVVSATETAIQRTTPLLVRIDTIGGFEKVGKEFVNEGTATGLLLDQDGYVITSAFNFLHDPTSILLRFSDGTKKIAKKMATDKNRMLTLLKVEGLDAGHFPTPLPIREKASIKIGEKCFAFGVALSQDEPNLTAGAISGVDRIWGKALQTDAAVGPNNYGGPLVDTEGRLLALLVPLSMMSKEVAAGAETYDAGVGLGIPFEDILRLLPKYKEGKDLEVGVIGIGFKENRTFIGDAVIDSIDPDSPAAKAEMKPGDKILAIDGVAIPSALQLSMNLHRRYVGETLKIRYLRDGKEHTVELTTVAPTEPE